MIIGIRKEWGKGGKELGRKVEGGITISRIKENKGREVVIVSIYNSGELMGDDRENN